MEKPSVTFRVLNKPTTCRKRINIKFIEHTSSFSQVNTLNFPREHYFLINQPFGADNEEMAGELYACTH